MYEPRAYRHWVKIKDLVSFNVVIKETDLRISAQTNLQKKAYRAASKHRDAVEGYIERNPSFLTSLEPIPLGADASAIVKAMSAAAEKADTGPMAAVAGAIAEFVGRELSAFSSEIIVENGGDIYLKSSRKRMVGIYAGSSPLTGKVGLEINGEDTPVGICTSSGTVGHSLSFGKADAAIVLSPSTALADAAATAIGNMVLKPDDIDTALDFAKSISGLKGTVIICGDSIGAWGEVKLCQMPGQDI